MAFDHKRVVKPPSRSRWNANQHQLHILESIFEQENGNTPTKSRIEEIAMQLSQFGQISYTNVYNWFQNRKARAKRKLHQQIGRVRRVGRDSETTSKVNPKEGEVKAEVDADEGETDAHSHRAKRSKAEGDQSPQNQSLGWVPNIDTGAGSSSVGRIEGLLNEDLRSNVDFATLATNPQLSSVEHANDMFNGHKFHEQGTVAVHTQLKERLEVEAWDLRTSYTESSQILDAQCQYPPHEDTLTLGSGLTGDKSIRLARGPAPSIGESRKVATESRDLMNEEAIPVAPETCV